MKRVAFITDIHLAEQFTIDNNVDAVKNFETALAHIAKSNITEIVFGGDIGEATAHSYFFDALKNFSLKLIIGNHDQFEKVKAHYTMEHVLDELYYKVEEGNYLYIFLDSSTDEISNTQLSWLQAILSTTKKVILFVHHPILAINTAVDALYPLKNREPLKEILIASQKNVTVFCGHYHMNDEQAYKNIKQYTTHSLSFQLIKDAETISVDNRNFGYRVIEIHATKIETELVNFKQN